VSRDGLTKTGTEEGQNWPPKKRMHDEKSGQGREGGREEGREGYPVAERAVIPVKVVRPGIPLDKEAFGCRCQERKRGRAGRRKR